MSEWSCTNTITLRGFTSTYEWIFLAAQLYFYLLQFWMREIYLWSTPPFTAFTDMLKWIVWTIIRFEVDFLLFASDCCDAGWSTCLESERYISQVWMLWAWTRLIGEKSSTLYSGFLLVYFLLCRSLDESKVESVCRVTLGWNPELHYERFGGALRRTVAVRPCLCFGSKENRHLASASIVSTFVMAASLRVHR